MIITGANTGIGKETLRDLAGRGARIIMASRNVELAEKVKTEIVIETSNQQIIVKKLDVSLCKSVREFADDIRKTEDKIDILIHNSGVSNLDYSTSEGLPMTFATNLYGPFLLTNLLLDLITKSPSARIIFVSSFLGLFGNCDFKELKENGKLSFHPGNKAYNITKYGLILLTYELAERLKNNEVYVNSLHPGVVNTGIFKPYWYLILLANIFNTFLKSPKQGAQTTLHVALDDAAKTQSKFYMECIGFNVFSGPSHRENGKILWNKLETITKLYQND